MDRPALDVTRLGSLGWQVRVVEETASTNADLLAQADAPDRSVLVAEHQSAGRGRLERSWTSPPRAGLTFSVLLRPSVPAERWGWLPLLAGVAVAEAVQDVAGLATTLKWPNDVLVGERKLAGILAQTAGGAVVVGIGLNVSTTADELPVDTATSLAVEGRDVDRTALLAAVLARLARRPDDVPAAYRERCSTLGRRVHVTLAAGASIDGVAEDVDELGRLLVDDGGTTHAVVAGDVTHVRPAT